MTHAHPRTRFNHRHLLGIADALRTTHLNEAVKRACAMLIEKAHAAGRPVGICGQAPSDYPEFAEFLVGLGIALYMGIDKLVALIKKVPQGLIADSAFFYIGLTSMIMGTLLFIGGFLGELISRSAVERNNYEIEKKV